MLAYYIYKLSYNVNCHKVLRGRCYHLHLGSEETGRAGSSVSACREDSDPSLSCPKVLALLKTGILISSFHDSGNNQIFFHHDILGMPPPAMSV